MVAFLLLANSKPLIFWSQWMYFAYSNEVATFVKIRWFGQGIKTLKWNNNDKYNCINPPFSKFLGRNG